MENESNNEQAPIRPYEADGIQELDNNLPSWWIGLFVFTSIFAMLYMFYMHLISGTSIRQEYDDSLKTTYNATTPTGRDHDEVYDLKAMIADSQSITKGHEVFTANCAPCHGGKGEGVIGPNLTDKYWLHGGKPEQIYQTVFAGVPEKGMPAWGPILGEHKARQLTAFIVSLQGTNPPNAKAPQGNLE